MKMQVTSNPLTVWREAPVITLLGEVQVNGGQVSPGLALEVWLVGANPKTSPLSRFGTEDRDALYGSSFDMKESTNATDYLSKCFKVSSNGSCDN